MARVLVIDDEPRIANFVSGALPKPFAVAELVGRIRARLRQPATGPDERFLRRGGVTLDLVRRVADAGQGEVVLSEREFLMLRNLMMRGGDGCTRQRLLEGGWGYGFDPGSNGGG